MAYSYPAAYDGMQIEFILCQWIKYYAIYCPICKSSVAANGWSLLIDHENDHLHELGSDQFGKGLDKNYASVMKALAVAGARRARRGKDAS